jgi:hypothetical protein
MSKKVKVNEKASHLEKVSGIFSWPVGTPRATQRGK